MSSWRLAIRALHGIGGSGTAARIDGLAGLGVEECGRALCKAALLGLAKSPGRRREPVWQITPRGVDFCENRIAQMEERPGGRRWVATWLSSLPRGVRIAGALLDLPADADVMAAINALPATRREQLRAQVDWVEDYDGRVE